MENIWHPTSRYCPSFRSFSWHTTLWCSTLWGPWDAGSSGCPIRFHITWFPPIIFGAAIWEEVYILENVFFPMLLWAWKQSSVQYSLHYIGEGVEAHKGSLRDWTKVTRPVEWLHQHSDSNVQTQKLGTFHLLIRVKSRRGRHDGHKNISFHFLHHSHYRGSSFWKCLNSWATRPTAAATPELESPRPIPPRTPSQRLETSLYVVWGKDGHRGAIWASPEDWAGQGGRRAVFSVGKGKIWTNKRSGAHLFRLEEVEFFCTFELFSQGWPLPPTQETNTETGLFQWGLWSLRATQAKQKEEGLGSKAGGVGGRGQTGRSWERRGETEWAVKMGKDGWWRKEQRERKGKAGEANIETF